jgi:hypothetical protein
MPAPLSGSLSNIPGFPAPFGNDRYVGACDHVGPSSYVQVVTGAPPSGGDTLYASEMGLKLIDRVIPSLSDDGQYEIFGVPVPGSSPNYAVLIWSIAATGAQVGAGVSLAARNAKVMAVGR